MHLPDGLLSAPVAAFGAVGGFGVAALAFRRSAADLAERQVPLLGTTAAFIFAAQMINVPVGPGVSGHFVGAALAAFLLGPAAACVAMMLVLMIQCLLFADGGLTALGTNFLNMGVIPIAVATAAAALARRVPRPWVVRVLAPTAAWLSIVLASGLCAAQIALSGHVPLRVIVPAMMGWHAIIGVVEALVTSAVLATLQVVRPDLLRGLALLEGISIVTPEATA